MKLDRNSFIAYNFKLNNYPKMDKTVFSSRKLK